MKTLITQKQFAEYIGIHPSQLSRDFVKKNLLPMEGKKIIMPDAAEVYYKYLGGLVKHNSPHIPHNTNNENTPINPDDKTMQDYLNAQVKKEDALGRIHEMNLQTKKGELLLVDKVSEEVVDVCQNIRTSMLNLPNKIAPLLENLSAEEIKIKMDAEINEIFTDLYKLKNKYIDSASNV